MNKEIVVDLVIPVLNGYEDLKILYASFNSQKNIKIANIVVPITIDKNIEEVNKTKEFCKKHNIITFDIPKEDFSHSLVREKAIFDYCKSDIVILLTQDVKLIDDNAMHNLVKDIASNEVVYTFGRQTCSKKRCIERYIRDFNYPSKSYIAKKEKIEQYQIKAFFASDVFAGLNRNIFIELGGYKGINIPTNEDMLYMHNLLMAGYHAKFCSDAIVEHYHSFTPRKLYKRYYDSGVFFKTVKIFDQYKKTDSGKQLALYILKQAFKHFDVITILRWLPDMSIRYIAMKKGSK